MKSFTQSFKFALILLLGVTVTMSACKKDETPDRVKFLGSYNVNENCDSGNFSFASAITESSTDENSVVVSNFGDFNVNVRATVNGDNININDTQGGITFSGSGNISGNTLTIIYTASAGGNTDDCTATFIKQ